MGAAREKRQARIGALQRNDEVCGRITLCLQIKLVGLGLDDIERRALSRSVARSGNAYPVTRCRAQGLEQGSRVYAHVGGLSQARSDSSASSISTPPVSSATRAISRCTQNASMPSMMVVIAAGCRNVTVPTCTALAPASVYSTASSAVEIPPHAMIGIRTAFAH